MFPNPRVLPAILTIAIFLVSPCAFAQAGNPFANTPAGQRPSATPPNAAQKHFAAGVQHLQKNKVDAALAEFQAAKKLMPNQPAVLMNIGVCYMRKKNLSAAESAFRQAYKIDPKMALAPLTQVLIQQGKDSQALPYLKKLAAANPKDYQLQSMLGGLYIKMKNYSGAASAFKSALAIKPNDKAALYNMALAQANLKKYPDARKTLAKSLAIGWDAQSAGLDAYICEQMGDKKAAIAAYEKIAAKRIPNVSREAYRSIVRLYDSMNKPEESIKVLKRAAAAEKGDYDINMNLGRILAGQGKYAESQTYLLAARKVRPDVSVNLYLAMNCLADPKTAANAEKYVQEAIRLNPKNFDQIDLLAYILQRQKKPDAAIAQYRKMEKLQPKNATVNTRIANVYMSQGKGDSAYSEYQKAMKKAPNDLSITVSAAGCLRSMDKLDDAVTLLKNAVAKSPKSEPAHGALGEAYEAQKKYDLAIAEYKKVVEINPKSVSAYQRLAQAYDASKDYESEIKMYRKLVELNPKDTQTPLTIARVYQKMGKLDEAAAELKKFVEANPKDMAALAQYGDLLVEKKDYDGAVTQYTGLTKNEDAGIKSYGHFLIGGARDKQGKKEDAIAAYKTCLEGTPGNRPALEAMKKAYDELKKPEEFQGYVKTLVADGKDNAPYDYFWTTFKDAKKTDEALKVLEDLGQKNLDSQPIHSALAKAYDDTGAKDKAIEQYKAILAKDKDDVMTEMALCEVYKSVDKNDEAVACYQNVLKLRPNAPTLHIGLGDLLTKMSKDKEAIAAYEEALKLQPGNPEVKGKIAFLKGEKPAPSVLPGPAVGPAPAPVPTPTPEPGAAAPAPTPTPAPPANATSDPAPAPTPAPPANTTPAPTPAP